jgi:hypothetical protein
MNPQWFGGGCRLDRGRVSSRSRMGHHHHELRGPLIQGFFKVGTAATDKNLWDRGPAVTSH